MTDATLNQFNNFNNYNQNIYFVIKNLKIKNKDNTCIFKL